MASYAYSCVVRLKSSKQNMLGTSNTTAQILMNSHITVPNINNKGVCLLCSFAVYLFIFLLSTTEWFLRCQHYGSYSLHCSLYFKTTLNNLSGGGGTDLERGYRDVQPWRPPFHTSPAAHKGPISSKRVSSQDPLLRKFGNFSLYSLNFHPNFSSQAPNLDIFSSQAPKFGNFPLTSPQIWKFSAHKPLFSEANVSSQAPHFGNPGRTPLPEKKLSAPRIYHYNINSLALSALNMLNARGCFLKYFSSSRNQT